PLAETAPAGLAAAGIEPALLPPAPKAELPERPELSYDPQQEQEQQGQIQGQGQGQGQVQAQPQPQPQAQPQDQQHQQHQQPMSLQKQAPQQQHHPVEQPAPQAPGSPQVPVAPETPQVPPTHDSPWFAAQKLPEGPHSSAYDPEYTEGLEPTPAAVPLGPGRTRPLGDVGTIGAVPHPRQEERPQVRAQAPEAAARVPEPDPEEAPQLEEWPQEDAEYADLAFEVFSAYTDQEGQYPSVEILDIHLADTRNVRHPRSTELLQRLMPEFRKAYVPAQATADQSA
ncbi:DUF2637 domain-containing protein, partial [Streptomyces bacillaris]